MKKSLYYVLAIWLTLSLVGCAAPAVASTPSSSSTEMPAVVTFADPVLEAMVRATMGKPEDDITLAEAVTRLNLSIEWQRYISKNCVRTVFAQNDYKIDIGYYPNIDAYVMMASKDGNLAMNYVYNHAKDSFSLVFKAE